IEAEATGEAQAQGRRGRQAMTGRPSNVELLERERRKAQAAEDDCIRAEIEAAIARGETSFLIPFPAPAPAMAFLIEHLKGVPVERVDAAWTDALRDLLRSDLELYPVTRQQVFDAYTQTSQQRLRAKDRAFIMW